MEHRMKPNILRKDAKGIYWENLALKLVLQRYYRETASCVGIGRPECSWGSGMRHFVAGMQMQFRRKPREKKHNCWIPSGLCVSR